jgi:hypothetical protein
LKEIGKSAFEKCAIKSIRIPSNVEVIGEECFVFCQCLCEVTFEPGSKLKEIVKCAFGATGVGTINIPAECESLTGLSLVGLKSVSISEGNKFFILRDDFVMNVSESVFIRYFGGSERIAIQSCVESISDGCFYNCRSLSEITFESGCQLKKIGKSTFHHCAIRSILIPSNVEVIGEECFSGCRDLCEVKFESDSQLKEIGRCAFMICAIKSIRIPSNVEVIGEGCFCGSLCEVIFESGSKLKRIHSNAFDGFLECVQLPMGFNVDYPWPNNCRIKYYDHVVGSETQE